jgi:uncharacterized membrane protein
MAEVELFHLLIEYIIIAIEAIVAIFIAGIVAITIFRLVNLGISRIKQTKQQKEEKIVNLMLRGLLLSLDFLIAADLLETILDPTTEELLKLILVVVIRILLTWSLGKEMKQPEYLKPDK